MTEKKINPLFQAGLEFQNLFEERKWPFCYIGGLAVIRWGEIRMTQDIDLCLSCGFGYEEQYVNLLTNDYKSRVPDAHSFALKNRVLLLYASNGVSVDISLSGLPFEDKMIERASLFAFQPECLLNTCSAEDLIILKAFAERPKDWVDIENIILHQGKKLDRKYILKQLRPLCELKEAPEIIDTLKKHFTKYLKF